jgi:hypothetical protein
VPGAERRAGDGGVQHHHHQHYDMDAAPYTEGARLGLTSSASPSPLSNAHSPAGSTGSSSASSSRVAAASAHYQHR